MKWLVKKFFKPLLKQALKAAVGELSEVVVRIVREAAKYEHWTDEQKRRHAFEAIKIEARERGKRLKDSVINFAIETAVQLIKEAL